MDYWHVTIAAEDRRTAFPDKEARLLAVRALVRVVGERLVLWSIVDDHVHLVFLGNRREVGRFAQRAALTLAPRLAPVRLEPARIRPVSGRSHLRTLVGYLLRQCHRHGLPTHPARYEGSCLFDLIGARRLPGYQAHALRALPRLRMRDVADAVGAHPAWVMPREDLAGIAPRALVEAAAAAVGVPELEGRTRPVASARAAVMRLSRQAGWPGPLMARALGIGSGSPDKERTAIRSTQVAPPPRDRERYWAARRPQRSETAR